MANKCYYNMKIVGATQEAVDEFIQMLDYSHPDGKFFARIFEAYPYTSYEENGNYVTQVTGDCAWSVYSCMCGGAFTYYDDNAKTTEKITNLAIETKRLGLKVEIFSQEPGIGFAEHIIFDNGHQILSEETDYSEYYNYDDLTLEEFEQEYGVTLTEEQKCQLADEDYIAVGGYDEVFTI